MSSITRAITELKRERDKVEVKLQRLDEALHTLDGLHRRGPGRPPKRRSGVRYMSTSARRRIAKAQRARWAKIKAKAK